MAAAESPDVFSESSTPSNTPPAPLETLDTDRRIANFFTQTGFADWQMAQFLCDNFAAEQLTLRRKNTDFARPGMPALFTTPVRGVVAARTVPTPGGNSRRVTVRPLYRQGSHSYTVECVTPGLRGLIVQFRHRRQPFGAGLIRGVEAVYASAGLAPRIIPLGPVERLKCLLPAAAASAAAATSSRSGNPRAPPPGPPSPPPPNPNGPFPPPPDIAVPVIAYVMTRVKGIPLCEFRSGRPHHPGSAEALEARTLLVRGMAAMFARANSYWQHQESPEGRGQPEREIAFPLGEHLRSIEEALPPSLALCASQLLAHCPAGLGGMFPGSEGARRPMFLTPPCPPAVVHDRARRLHLAHGNAVPRKVLVDPLTGRLEGLVGWSTAQWLPFGAGLYALEQVLGGNTPFSPSSASPDWAAGDLRSEGSWQYYPEAARLRDRFWTWFRDEAKKLPRDPSTSRHIPRREEAEWGRMAGILLHGIGFDESVDRGFSAVMPFFPPAVEDFELMARLELWIEAGAGVPRKRRISGQDSTPETWPDKLVRMWRASKKALRDGRRHDGKERRIRSHK